MSDFLVHINAAPYVAEFINHHFGMVVDSVPVVEFDKYTVESRILKTYLQKPPKDYVPENPDDFNLHIRLPFYKSKDPRTYFYLSEKSKKVLADQLENLFCINLWAELIPTLSSKNNTNNVIYAYMERHHISEVHHETIRQKFYRLRKKYLEENDVNI